MADNTGYEPETLDFSSLLSHRFDCKNHSMCPVQNLWGDKMASLHIYLYRGSGVQSCAKYTVQQNHYININFTNFTDVSQVTHISKTEESLQEAFSLQQRHGLKCPEMFSFFSRSVPHKESRCCVLPGKSTTAYSTLLIIQMF